MIDVFMLILAGCIGLWHTIGMWLEYTQEGWPHRIEMLADISLVLITCYAGLSAYQKVIGG